MYRRIAATNEDLLNEERGIDGNKDEGRKARYWWWWRETSAAPKENESNHFGAFLVGGYILLLFLLGAYYSDWPPPAYTSFVAMAPTTAKVTDTTIPVPSRATISSMSDLLKYADELDCAKELHVSYARLYQEISSHTILNKTGLCRSEQDRRCMNPTISDPNRIVNKRLAWWDGFQRNKNMVAAAAAANKQLDVAFFGDSIAEYWIGTNLNSSGNIEMSNMPKIFQEIFGEHGIPLGLAGDRCNQLIYRLKHGEMIDTFNPKTWWILVGTNDYASDSTRESVLVGIMAVLKELFDGGKRSTATKFVLQAILPRDKHTLPTRDKNFIHLFHPEEDFEWINQRLSCLAQALPSQLAFFNATDLFMTKNSIDGTPTRLINETLMHNLLYLSEEGYRIWGSAIVEKLQEWGIWSRND